MSQNRLIDYLEHIQQAAQNACDFIDGQVKEDFFADKRTQQAVIMSLVDHRRGGHKGDGRVCRFRCGASGNPGGAACVVCVIVLPMVISTLTSMLCGKRSKTALPELSRQLTGSNAVQDGCGVRPGVGRAPAPTRNPAPPLNFPRLAAISYGLSGWENSLCSR